MRSIGLVGPARSGKSTVAGYLRDRHGFVVVGFADALKDAALALDPIIEVPADHVFRLSDLVKRFGWEDAKDSFPEVRRILQRLGDEAGRRVHGEDTWVNIAKRRIRTARLCGYPVVVPDVRYPNEADALIRMGFDIVRLDRPGHVSAADSSHASERLLSEIRPDYHVSNHGTVDDLAARIETVLADSGD